MITIYRYRPSDRSSQWIKNDDISLQIQDLRATDDVLWIEMDRTNEAEEKTIFEELLPIHMLTREDVTRERRYPENQPHLPKVEEFPDYLFVIVNPLRTGVAELPKGSLRAPLVTQLSAILTPTRLLTYHVDPVPAVSDLRSYLERHSEQGQRGPDYLFHLILDSMVDAYAPVLDLVTDSLAKMESLVLTKPARATTPRLLRLKRHIIALRKTLVHEREVLARLSRGEFAMIDERETVYYRNVYDHLVRFNEMIEGAREMTSDLMESHLAATSNRLNEIMKVLTMISTTVLPMTLVAGVYGMNFHHIPELSWSHGYVWAIGLMLLVGIIPLAFFKWRKWF